MEPSWGTIRPSVTQSGARTRAAFDYQDQCVALTVLQRLLAGNLKGVLVEFATDLVVFPKGGAPELVSVKHRGPNHSRSTGWTPSALNKDRVLLDLFRFWNASDRQATATVYSPGGLQGEATHLSRHHHDAASRKIVTAMLAKSGVPQCDAQEFANALFWPDTPLPLAAHIDDNIRARLRDLLAARGRRESGVETAYDALLGTVRAASTERADRTSRYATLAQKVAQADDDLHDRRYLSARTLIDTLVTAADSRLTAID